jgi:4-amino-4-deoxy-L-arabinose transferase-like glycosyltransferase
MLISPCLSNPVPASLRHSLILLLLWTLGAALDRTWLHLDQGMPDWDQADYLTGAMNYWQALKQPNWLSQDWWVGLWQLSSKIPPLVYVVTAAVMGLVGTGADQAMMIHLLFSAVMILSLYSLGRSLFSAVVGLWAAGLAMVLPGLYPLRHEFLLDHPLAAMVTLCFALLTAWYQPKGKDEVWSEVAIPLPPLDETGKTQLQLLQETIALLPTKPESPQRYRRPRSLVLLSKQWEAIGEGFANLFSNPWLKVLAFGLALGLGLLTKQTIIFFLFVPLLWAGVSLLFKRQWGRIAQLFVGLSLSMAIAYPWYRTNWLLILTSGERATVQSAIAEGDPAINTLAAWTYYLTEIAQQVSVPLLVTGLVGLLLYSKRVFERGNRLENLNFSSREQRRQLFQNWRRSRSWLLVFLIGGYLLFSLNPNKDTRYIAPLLPALSVLLAQGLLLFPRYFAFLRLGLLGLMGLLMMSNLFPILPGKASHLAKPPQNWHLQDAIATILQTQPNLRQNVGVLPSIPELNQHNFNYFGTLANFQVYGRQVGARDQQVWSDSRSLPWYLLKTGEQGAIRKPQALEALTKAITTGKDFRLEQTWKLPDASDLNLYRRITPAVTVTPVVGAQWGDEQLLRLEQVVVPKIAQAGKPIPVTYKWAGSGADLQSGLLLLRWANGQGQWLHDHGLGLGELTNLEPKKLYQVNETLAMLPPGNASGNYSLEALYLNRTTGEIYPIVPPEVTIAIGSPAPDSKPTKPAPVPELDALTKLRLMATELPKGPAALEKIFDQVARLNLYDPTQNYLIQAQESLAYRLKENPKNKQYAYAYAFTQVLRRNVGGAIAAFDTVTQLDPQNPNANAYLAFVNLADLRPRVAQIAIETAQQQPNPGKEIKGLGAIAKLMQGNLVGAWQDFQNFQKEK